MRLHIIYPGGDRTKIKVCEVYDDLYDYDVASRRDFDEYDIDEAIEYAKMLAKQNNLEYVGNNLERNNYLD
jgi:hypothetical protein